MLKHITVAKPQVTEAGGREVAEDGVAGAGGCGGKEELDVGLEGWRRA
jgi:hypothetical protein